MNISRAHFVGYAAMFIYIGFIIGGLVIDSLYKNEDLAYCTALRNVNNYVVQEHRQALDDYPKYEKLGWNTDKSSEWWGYVMALQDVNGKIADYIVEADC